MKSSAAESKATSAPVIPAPRIERRRVSPVIEQAALEAGLHPVAARVIASRVPEETDIRRFLKPGLSHLDDPGTLPDIARAARRIADAVMVGEDVIVAVDYDCDGISALVVVVESLRRFGLAPEHIHRYIGLRLKDGYGLSDGLVDRILAAKNEPGLVITCDCGSSDEARIARLAGQGIDTIVSDHHLIPPEGIPASALAVVSPAREESAYQDRAIAGCMVAFLLMSMVRRELIAQGHLQPSEAVLTDLLGFVAIGTISDCVSMANSLNNRIVVQAGLRIINQSDRPCWATIRRLSRNPEEPVTAETVAFTIGPMTNAQGRLDNALTAVDFYLAETEERAEEVYRVLTQANEERKRIERELNDQAIRIAAEQVACGHRSLVVYLPDGHAGVHGISSSRLVEAFGRPAIIFSPMPGQTEKLTGSARSGGRDFHMREALQWIADRYPGLQTKFGGHKGAAGSGVMANDILRFREAFEEAVRLQLGEEDVGPVIQSDGELHGQDIHLALVDALSLLEPFGREFDSALFEVSIKVAEVRAVGDGTHLRVAGCIDGALFTAIWFRARRSKEEPLPLSNGDQVRAVVALRGSTFRGQRRVELHIRHIER
jgi:single-stranded-DNA-specific exonuclease